MMSILKRLALPFAVLAIIAPGSALAQKNGGAGSGATVIPGGTQNATFVISKAGAYVLGGDRIMSNAALNNVEIQAPDVTLDLGGFSLSHPIDSSGNGSGIQIGAVENVEIRGGSILHAALNGIYSTNGKGLRLVDLRVMNSHLNGVISSMEDASAERCHVADSGSDGLRFSGEGSVVQDCVVSNSNNNGITVGAYGRVVRCTSRGSVYGVWLNEYSTVTDSIVAKGTNTGVYAKLYCQVRNNQIVANGGYGVYTAGSHVEIKDNNIADTRLHAGAQFGIQSVGATTVISNNRLTANGTNIQGAYTNGGGNVLQ